MAAPRRSMLLQGLWLTVRRPRVLGWTYLLNLLVALVFTLRPWAEFGDVLNHSLAAQRLTTGFDLGTLFAAGMRVGQHNPSSGIAPYLALPVYGAVYFLLTAGTLFVYHIAAPGRVSILISSGFTFFWRFVRITLLALLAYAVLLGPLVAINSALQTRYTDAHVGWSTVWVRGLGALVLILAASAIRLYFDLVEVYTVQLNDRLRPSGVPDRRVRKALGPAWRLLRGNFLRAYGTFVLVGALGSVVAFVLTRTAVHMLAQPRVWPMLLLGQASVLVLLTTRLWQRAAETILACDNPLPAPVAAAAPEAALPHVVGPAVVVPTETVSPGTAPPRWEEGRGEPA